MISREQFESAQKQAREYLARAGIVITPEEAANIEVADFGLNELDGTGLELVVYVNTDQDTYNVWHEIVLKPGEQYTLPPNTPHWFQAGDEGAVVSEFSTKSRDESDIFMDPEIQRAPKVSD